MSRPRLLLLGTGITALLVLAGIASNGRPLSGGRGRGPTPVFFDYAYTTLALGAVAIFAVFLYVVVTLKPVRAKPRRSNMALWSTLLAMSLFVGLGALILHSTEGRRLRHAFELGTGLGQQPQTKAPHNPAARPARLRWDEILLIVALLGGVGVLVVVTRPRARPLLSRERPQEAVAAVLDDSLDDLRNEPDLRRAIIAAYARMERALAAAGLPRRPSEAPFEYVERALGELDASAEAVHRLTGLFEWAKFSQHEPEPAMRDEAIDALAAVRDELRAPAQAAVA